MPGHQKRRPPSQQPRFGASEKHPAASRLLPGAKLRGRGAWAFTASEAPARRRRAPASLLQRERSGPPIADLARRAHTHTTRPEVSQGSAGLKGPCSRLRGLPDAAIRPRLSWRERRRRGHARGRGAADPGSGALLIYCRRRSLITKPDNKASAPVANNGPCHRRPGRRSRRRRRHGQCGYPAGNQTLLDCKRMYNQEEGVDEDVATVSADMNV